MIADFWLGALVAVTVVLSVLVTVGAMLIAWLYRRLAKFVDVQLTRKKGGVVLSAEVKS